MACAFIGAAIGMLSRRPSPLRTPSSLRASPPQGHPNTTLLGFRVCPQTPGRLKITLLSWHAEPLPKRSEATTPTGGRRCGRAHDRREDLSKVRACARRSTMQASYFNRPRPQGPAGPQPKRAKDNFDPTLAAASAPPLDRGDDGEGPGSAAWRERGRGSSGAQDVKAPREGSSRQPALPPRLRATPRCDPRPPPLGSANRRLPTRCEKIARRPRHPCLLRWDRCGATNTSQVEKLQKNIHDRRDKTPRPAGTQRKEVDGKSRATDDAGNFSGAREDLL